MDIYRAVSTLSSVVFGPAKVSSREANMTATTHTHTHTHTNTHTHTHRHTHTHTQTLQDRQLLHIYSKKETEMYCYEQNITE